jgi:hypothetical protein
MTSTRALQHKYVGRVYNLLDEYLHFIWLRNTLEYLHFFPSKVSQITDLNIFTRFSVVLTIFSQKIMGPVQNSLKNQCYIFHMTQRTEYFEPRALEFCVSATLVSYNWIVPKNTLTRLRRYYWKLEFWICSINFHSNKKY